MAKFITRSCLIVLALSLSGLLGCASQGKEIILESSGGKPGWVTTDKDSYLQDDKVYFRGLVDRQKTLDMAFSRAKFRAVSNITQSVTMNIQTAFGETVEVDSNDVDNPSSASQGSSIKTEIAAIAKAVQLSGVNQEASYWEKVSTTTAGGDEVVAYKVFTLVSIPQKALKKAQVQAVQQGLVMANKLRNEQAKASLNEALDDLKKEMTE